MNPAAVSNLAKRGRDTLAATHASRVMFRGVELVIARPKVDPSISLGLGGIKTGALFHLRIPAEVQPPPKLKEEFKDIETGRRFFVSSCDPALSGCSAAAVHIVEATLA